jgi:hypothetical protein
MASKLPQLVFTDRREPPTKTKPIYSRQRSKSLDGPRSARIIRAPAAEFKVASDNLPSRSMRVSSTVPPQQSPLKSPRHSLQRLPSRSFDNFEELHDCPCSPSSVASCIKKLDPISVPHQSENPLVNQIYNGSKVFWKCRVTVRVVIFYHVKDECFEVVTYSYRDKKEINRLYAKRSTLSKYTERSSDLKEVKVY